MRNTCVCGNVQCASKNIQIFYASLNVITACVDSVSVLIFNYYQFSKHICHTHADG